MAIAEEFLERSRLFRRLKNSAHGQLVEFYAARLVEVGLARHGTWRCLNVVGSPLHWMASHRARLTNLDERMVERYLGQQGTKQSIQLGDRAALKRWLLTLHTARADLRGVWRLSAKRARSGSEEYRAPPACDPPVSL